MTVFGRAGRYPQKPEVTNVAPLTLEDLKRYKPSPNTGQLKSLKASHHRIARLFAVGLRPREVAEQVGHSFATVSNLHRDPAFKELIASYMKDVDVEFREAADQYYSAMVEGRTVAMRRLVDKLADEEEDFSVRELLQVHDSFADRTGYSKRTVSVNVNLDFAARLDKAVQRSRAVKAPALGDEVTAHHPKLIDLTPASAAQPDLGGEKGEAPAPAVESPPTFRRRA